ncbi:hypothetical protein XC62_22985, partial [Klebsiella pneumoniae]|nr:hypothetical protein [Klebsiella pneumoniae]
LAEPYSFFTLVINHGADMCFTTAAGYRGRSRFTFYRLFRGDPRNWFWSRSCDEHRTATRTGASVHAPQNNGDPVTAIIWIYWFWVIQIRGHRSFLGFIALVRRS